MKERPIIFSAPMILAVLENRKTQTRRVCTPTAFYSCPYGDLGNKLWVRETFTLQCDVNGDSPPFTDGRPVKYISDSDGDHWLQPHYRATDSEPALSCERPNCKRSDDPHCHWRPSIFMPRWASRITLEITDVRVQRVQEITEGDAVAEGVQVPVVRESSGYRGRYAVLWDRINAKRGFPWESNPWVWALTFSRYHRPLPTVAK